MLSIRRQNRDMGGFIVSGTLFKGWYSHYSKALYNQTTGGQEASLTFWREDSSRGFPLAFLQLLVFAPLLLDLMPPVSWQLHNFQW